MNARLSFSGLIGLGLALLLVLGKPTSLTAAPAEQPLGTASGGLLGKLQGSLPAAAKVDQVHIRLISEQQALVAGQRHWFGLVLEHEPGWHTYWRNPGDSGLATTASWRLQDATGASVAEPRLISQAWPTPSRLAVGPLANYGYENQVVLGFELEIPKGLTGSRQLIAEASWLVCKDVCIPGEAKLAIDLPVVATTQQAPPGLDAPLFAQMRGRLPVGADWGQGFAVDLQANVLMLWGQGEWSSRQGLWFVELEELINPAAGQSWFALPQGWLVKIPLSERPKRALATLEKTGQLHAVLKPSGTSGTSGTGGAAPAAQSPGPSGYRLQFVRQAAPVLGEAKAVWQSPMASEESHGADAGSISGSSLWVILGLAFLGGMVLNLMPCVFPVLGLKVLAFSQQAHSPGQAWRHAAFFTAGVLVSMLALAGLLIGLRAAGEAVGWGFQLQNPWVVLSLAVLFTGIGLNLLGVFEVGTSLTQLGEFDRGHGPLAAFGSGVLAVVVASPCTAPFMGSAIGYTATAPAAQTLAVFAVLGLGLAAPYGLAAIWPGLLTRLPRPGPWMVTLKQFLAFPMLATVAWLVWVLTQQQGLSVLMPVLLTLVLLSFAAWCWGGLQAARLGAGLPLGGRLWRWIGIALALVLSVWLVRPVGELSPTVSVTKGSTSASSGATTATILWQPWASGKPESLAAQGRVVLVDFTAAWCITCQANKIRVLQTSPVVDQLNGVAVVPLMADWTKQDPAITKELQRYGRNGVPLYLVYGPKLSKPIVLGEWLSTDAVMAALREAGLQN